MTRPIDRTAHGFETDAFNQREEPFLQRHPPVTLVGRFECVAEVEASSQAAVLLEGIGLSESDVIGRNWIVS